MPAVGMRALVPPISGSPSPHGLLGGCIDVISTNDVHELNGTDMLSSSCAQANQWQDCPAPGAGEFPWVNPTSKTFDRPEQCTFEPVTVYAGSDCSTVGTTREEVNARALEALRLGEQRALEDFFMRRWLANATHTTDLTGTDALHVVNGIGLLEAWLATEYGGQGVLHVPAGAASLLAMHRQVDLAGEAECPRTLMGNAVVLGAGYAVNVGPATPPAVPAAAPAGEAWLYITPPMRIRRDAPTLASVPESLSVNTLINDRFAIAETTFVPEVACCMAAAVRVSLSACC